MLVKCNCMVIYNAIYIDIDECLEARDGCAQMCNNTVGSFACYCNSGYRLASDNQGCNGKASIILVMGLTNCRY